MKLKYPFEGEHPITQRFGENPKSYAKFKLAGHEGVDWSMPQGTSISSPISGKTYVGWAPTTWGLFYAIENEECTVYLCHLKENYLASDQQVTAGQLIGESGNTGNSTGPHLHLCLRVKGISNPPMKDFVDPLPYFEERQVEPSPPAQQAANETTIDAYRDLKDDIIKAANPPLDKRGVPELIGWIAGLKTSADSHKDFVRAIGELVGCGSEDEEAVKEAVKGQIAIISTDILTLKNKKLMEFDWKDLLWGFITKLIYRK